MASNRIAILPSITSSGLKSIFILSDTRASYFVPRYFIVTINDMGHFVFSRVVVVNWLSLLYSTHFLYIVPLLSSIF